MGNAWNSEQEGKAEAQPSGLDPRQRTKHYQFYSLAPTPCLPQSQGNLSKQLPIVFI